MLSQQFFGGKDQIYLAAMRRILADFGAEVRGELRSAAPDDRAAAIYRTLGTCFGYAIAHFTRFYEIRHLQVLGRVLSGPGGELLLEHANKVLRDEFPDLAKSLEVSMPDETQKRHGQAIAAASLPRL